MFLFLLDFASVFEIVRVLINFFKVLLLLAMAIVYVVTVH